jgi:hypothetical protein
MHGLFLLSCPKAGANQLRNGDECPRAYVVLQNGCFITKNEILEHVNSQCSKHKRITGGMIFVEAIPKTPVSSPPFVLSIEWEFYTRILTN